MIEQTSLTSFEGLRNSPVLGEMQLAVLHCLKDNDPLTDRELESMLPHLRENVRKRRNELAIAGLVTSYGVRQCRITGRMAKVWGYLEQEGD